MGIALIFRWLCLFVIGIIPFAHADKPLKSVADLRYGVSLYEYYQGNHFEALSELLVADERGGVQGHKNSPEVIKGGIQLAFGMEQTAETLFRSLTDEDRPETVRNAAWFYLSRLQYQRNKFEQARETYSQIEGKLPQSILSDVPALNVQLLTREGNYNSALKALEAVESKRSKNDSMRFWRPFLNYNLATVLIRQEKYDEALSLFSKVSSERLSVDENFRTEQLAMYDKAFTAAGYGYFQQEDYTNAQTQFGQVRQDSPLANDALLGYGWSIARQGDYQAAIAPWRVLSERPLADDAVQESLMAIPYAYLQLGNTAQAIAGYQSAEAVYLEQLDLIDEAGIEILNQSLVELLELDNPNTNYNWLLPEENSLVKPHIRYLIQLFSLNRFQNAVQNVRDLYRIQQTLEAWQLSLDAYDDMMIYRREAFNAPSVVEDTKDRQANLQQLLEKQKQLRGQLDRARESEDVFFMLDEDRSDLLRFLTSGEKNLKILAAADEYVDEEAAWLSRYRGLLLWSATQDFDARLWALESQLREVDQNLSSAQKTDVTINQLLNEAPDISSGQQRIQAGRREVEALLNQNSLLMDKLEETLREQIFLALGLQRQRIQFYLSEARLAVAQIYDNLYLEQQQ